MLFWVVLDNERDESQDEGNQGKMSGATPKTAGQSSPKPLQGHQRTGGQNYSAGVGVHFTSMLSPPLAL